MEEKNTVPAAIPPAGTEDIPTRKDRRPIIIAVAAVAATVLAVGGVRIQGLREPSGVSGAPGVRIGRRGSVEGREIV